MGSTIELCSGSTELAKAPAELATDSAEAARDSSELLVQVWEKLEGGYKIIGQNHREEKREK